MKRIKSRILATWDQLNEPVPVQFSDVDSMKLVWHGHYLRYCESARERFCGERGLSYQAMEDEGCIAPLVRMQIEYLAPARMGWLLEVRCGRVPDSQPFLNLLYEIRGPLGEARSRLLCIAESVQVFVDRGGVPYLSPPPPVQAFFAAITTREGAAPPPT